MRACSPEAGVHPAALQALAVQAYSGMLAQTLSERLPKIQEALDDPLLPADDFYVFFDGRQYLPRLDSTQGRRLDAGAIPLREQRIHDHAIHLMPVAEDLAWTVWMGERLAAE